MLGLLSDLDRKNCWSIAEDRGAKTPDALQHLLSRSLWEADLIRDDLCGYVVDRRGHPDAVLVVDETEDHPHGWTGWIEADTARRCTNQAGGRSSPPGDSDWGALLILGALPRRSGR